MIKMTMLKHDKWLSEKLGKESYRLTSTSELMAAPEPEKILNDCEFIFGLCSTDDLSELHFLEKNRFNLVDTRVSFEKNAQLKTVPNSSNVTLRHAIPEDRNEVCAIAGSDFLCSRFHLDPKIENKIANAIKCEWINNYFYGKRGNDMIIAGIDGKVAGFLSILCDQEKKKAVIDLVCVSNKFQKQGVGLLLLAYFENEYIDHTLNVGTQVANIASMRCYTRSGFSPVETKYIVHRHQDS